MTRQNRVMPDGTILAVPERGTLTGNRGILHDAAGQLGQARWRHKHWIACALDYNQVRRRVMSPGTWTELFFLDEAVALAAGHRPCALCRRGDYNAFRTAWAGAFGAAVSASQMDTILHETRLCPGSRTQQTFTADAATLPPGTFVGPADRPLLVLESCALPFSPAGYGAPEPRPAGQTIVRTPRPVVALLGAGYRPRLHPSATLRPAAPSA